MEQSDTEEIVSSADSWESEEGSVVTGNSSVFAKRTRLSFHQLVSKFSSSSASSSEDEKSSDTGEGELSDSEGAEEVASVGNIEEDLDYSINRYCNELYREDVKNRHDATSGRSCSVLGFEGRQGRY